MRMDKLTSRLQEAIGEAQSLAVGQSHNAIEPVHLLLALMQQQGGVAAPLLEKAGANPADVVTALKMALDKLPTVGQFTGDVQLSQNLARLFNLADREARRDDENARALLLDEQGRITETVAASFLIVVGTQVISPVAERVLPGISLQVLRELCDDLGLEFEQQELQAADLDRADEALVASTPYCLAPVTRINGQPVGDGEPGPIADRLLTAWDTLVGLDIRKQIRQGAQLRRASLATLPEHY